MCYKQRCKVVSLNLAHPVYVIFPDNAHTVSVRYFAVNYVYATYNQRLKNQH